MNTRLIIDLGNTNFRAALFEKRKLISLVSSPAKKAGDFLKGIKSLLYEKAAISSVIKNPSEIIKVVEKQTNNILFLNNKTAVPVGIGYQTPLTLGMDRLALAVAGNSKFRGKNVLVISAGTCITYEFISHENIYYGGAISPGLEMRFRSLQHFTAKLPLVKLTEPMEITGKSTEDSILNGVVYGVIHEINGTINVYNKKYPGIKTILTGGNSNYLADKLKKCNFAEPNLLLYGLDEILSYNEK